MAPIRPVPSSVQTKRPVAAAHRNRAQAALVMIRVDGDLRIVKKHLRSGFALPRVGQLLAERITRSGLDATRREDYLTRGSRI